jgi:hypothetical protein
MQRKNIHRRVTGSPQRFQCVLARHRDAAAFESRLVFYELVQETSGTAYWTLVQSGRTRLAEG